MDTVAAVGTVANGLNPHSADTGNVDIRLRTGVAQKVFHITAQHECRYNFALNSVAPAWPELALPGAHSDIGGGYLPQLREDLFLTRPLVETLPHNQPGAQSHVYQQTMRSCTCWRTHLPSGPLFVPVLSPRTSGRTISPRRPVQPATEAHLAALTLRHRTVFDWSKVALRVMADAAAEAGHCWPTLIKPKTRPA
jgi:hypothetical protein